MFNLLVLSIITACSIVNSTIIGNYMHLVNSTYCGLSRSIPVDEFGHGHCFKFHRHGLAKLVEAYNATPGDAPWAILVKIEISPTNISHCAGTLIDPNWVLTAAHCITSQTITVWTAYDWSIQNNKSYKAMFPIQYPGFEVWPNMFRIIDDIALLRLDKPIPLQLDSTNTYYVVNTICLPMDMVVNQHNEYVQLAGWDFRVQPYRFQIAYREMAMFRVKDEHKITHYSVGGGRICAGDSGGGLYQYHMGRAVVIGVVTSVDRMAFNMDEWGCQEDPNRAEAERVSSFISWLQFMLRQDAGHVVG